MKKILSAFAAVCALGTLALPIDAVAGPQQERMKRCNQDAREQGLKGDARKQFMSGCLKGKHAPAAEAAAAGGKAAKSKEKQEEAKDAAGKRADGAKRKACNQAATEQSLSGAKRKAFIADCMSA